jgi:hypothetical protein
VAALVAAAVVVLALGALLLLGPKVEDGTGGTDAGGAGGTGSGSEPSGAGAGGTVAESAPDGAVPADVLVARERAAALFAGERVGAALAELEPLLLRDPVDPDDLVRVAICVRELDQDPDRVRTLLERALELNEADAAAHYVLGRHLFEVVESEAALYHFERASELAPDDYPTRLALGKVLYDAGVFDDVPEYVERAEAIYAELYERGLEFGGSWYLSATYMYGQLLLDLERIDEGDAVLDRWTELKQRAVPEPTNRDLLRGTLGRVAAPRPVARQAPERAALAFAEVASWEGLEPDGHPLFMSPTEGWFAVNAGDVADAVPVPGGPPLSSELPAGELFWAARDGLWRLDRSGARVRVLAGDFTRVVPIELGEDRETRLEIRGEIDGAAYRVRSASSDLELAVARGAQVLLYRTGEAFGAFEEEPEVVATFESDVADLVASDVDHDGDLDLVVAGAFGLRLLRHDGAEVEGDGENGGASDGGEAPTPGRFTLVEFDAPGANRAFTHLLTEDLDTDNDVDLIATGPSGVLLLDNDRGGLWSDRSERLPAELTGPRAPVVADFDGDALPDLYGGAEPSAYTSRFGELFVRASDAPTIEEVLATADPYASGAVDLLHARETGGLAAERPLGGDRAALFDGVTVVSATVGDSDRDGLSDVLVADANGTVRLFERAPDPSARSLCLALEGVKDNARGVGAIVEVRAGEVYRRLYWRGEPLALGIGPHERADVLRVTWPNGVVQSLIDVPADVPLVVSQAEGLVGSCPFLYTWDGTRYVFVSDVIGITPLGLPMAPGMLVPPDHDEWVLVRGDQLAPKDGELVLQLTEELREVTYFDQVFIEAVDRPAGVAIYPNERFQFPPFPREHVFTVTESHAPLAALGSDGRDWAPELAEVDGEMSAPFVPYRGQFLGLATPHTLELRFDPDAVAAGQNLRLVLTGWLYWTDASVNMAAARHPDHAFVPPILAVPDGAGGWRDLGPPVGFPAGKTKAMVIELEPGTLDPADPRIRIFSTLRLYWDEIRLATCNDDEPLVRTRLAPASTNLWERGFSEPVMVGGDRLLEWFDWDGLAPQPRWNMHPGMYTKLGDVTPLIETVDDLFVVMGSGDCLTVRFDANALPPLPEGWTRDWLVFLDGWAKDRDPNTHEALFVEPLPFHGMSSYPPPPGEAHPDDARTRAWRRDWQTRPARRWIEPIVPR